MLESENNVPLFSDVDFQDVASHSLDSGIPVRGTTQHRHPATVSREGCIDLLQISVLDKKPHDIQWASVCADDVARVDKLWTYLQGVMKGLGQVLKRLISSLLLEPMGFPESPPLALWCPDPGEISSFLLRAHWVLSILLWLTGTSPWLPRGCLAWQGLT